MLERRPVEAFGHLTASALIHVFNGIRRRSARAPALKLLEISVDFVRIAFPLSFIPVRLSVSRPPCDAILKAHVVWLLLMPFAVHLESLCCAVRRENQSTICKWHGLHNGSMWRSCRVWAKFWCRVRTFMHMGVARIHNQSCNQTRASCICMSSTG